MGTHFKSLMYICSMVIFKPLMKEVAEFLDHETIIGTKGSDFFVI